MSQKLTPIAAKIAELEKERKRLQEINASGQCTMLEFGENAGTIRRISDSLSVLKSILPAEREAMEEYGTLCLREGAKRVKYRNYAPESIVEIFDQTFTQNTQP